MTKKKTNEPPFEKMLEDLQSLVEKLEGGELTLEESLAAYENGIGLVRGAQGKLDAMDQRLRELTTNGDLKPLETRLHAEKGDEV